MYLEHYGLLRPPFEMTPDPAFLYLGEAHQEGLATLVYGLRARKGFVMLTGEVGTGKTTLLHALLSQMDPNTVSAFLFNPRLGVLSDLFRRLPRICDDSLFFGKALGPDHFTDLLDLPCRLVELYSVFLELLFCGLAGRCGFGQGGPDPAVPSGEELFRLLCQEPVYDAGQNNEVDRSPEKIPPVRALVASRLAPS